MSRPLKIAHLYPELLNLYADKGNILTLVRRLQWRNIEVVVEPVSLTDELHLNAYDLVLLGGGSDREQAIIGENLRPFQAEWKAAVANGLPVLAICGGYQLIGEYYELPNGEKVAGLHVLDLHTIAGGHDTARLIGNIAIESPECGTIVGFENHGGRTYHNYASLGKVLKGHGNNGSDGREGVRHLNVFGTYIHGPLLPKNPVLADTILHIALEYAGMPQELAPLQDEFELAAQQAFLTKRIHV